MARNQYGAKHGVFQGRTGHAYALPTKRTPYIRFEGLSDVTGYLEDFALQVLMAPEERYFLTLVGCKLAGFDTQAMGLHLVKVLGQVFEKHACLEAFERINWPMFWVGFAATEWSRLDFKVNGGFASALQVEGRLDR